MNVNSLFIFYAMIVQTLRISAQFNMLSAIPYLKSPSNPFNSFHACIHSIHLFTDRWLIHSKGKTKKKNME